MLGCYEFIQANFPVVNKPAGDCTMYRGELLSTMQDMEDPDFVSTLKQ